MGLLYLYVPLIAARSTQELTDCAHDKHQAGSSADFTDTENGKGKGERKGREKTTKDRRNTRLTITTKLKVQGTAKLLF